MELTQQFLVGLLRYTTQMRSDMLVHLTDTDLPADRQCMPDTREG
jgi:hypothetical protein